MAWRQHCPKWGIKAREDDLGCQNLRYALRCLTAFTLRSPCVPRHRVSFPHPRCLPIKFSVKSSRNRGAWTENRFYDKVGTPLAWCHWRNQSEISPFSIWMQGDVWVCRNMSLLSRCDTFCRWLPGSLWGRCILLSCTRNSSCLFISDINTYFSTDVSS